MMGMNWHADVSILWWYSVVVSISGCDPLDPGSNPGTAIPFWSHHIIPTSIFALKNRHNVIT
jgi:hypothetical protein